MTFFSFTWQRPSRRTLAFFSALILSLSLWGCNSDKNTAQAETKVTPELEAQVLEVIRKNPQVIIDAVQQYQQAQQQEDQQKAQQAGTDFQKKLTSDPKSVIGDSPVFGAKDNKVVMIEFSDFQCPFCSRAHATIQSFMEKHQDTVTLSYKFLPLIQIHPQAAPAAEAAWAAQQQGKFWEYHDRLFENQAKLGEDLYQAIAKDLGLDLKKFETDRKAAPVAIQKDIDLAKQLSLNGTPTFFLASKETGKFEAFSGALTLEEYEAKLKLVTTP